MRAWPPRANPRRKSGPRAYPTMERATDVRAPTVSAAARAGFGFACWRSGSWSARYQIDKQRALARSGMETNECPGVLSAPVGVGGAAAKDRRDVLGADIVLECALLDGIAVDDKASEIR